MTKIEVLPYYWTENHFHTIAHISQREIPIPAWDSNEEGFVGVNDLIDLHQTQLRKFWFRGDWAIRLGAVINVGYCPDCDIIFVEMTKWQGIELAELFSWMLAFDPDLRSIVTEG